MKPPRLRKHALISKYDFDLDNYKEEQMSVSDAPLLRHDVGSIFKKDYKGKEVVVKVTKHGYMYNGKPYRTLSAAVKKITGRPTPANVFFGLDTTPRGEKKRKKRASNGEAIPVANDRTLDTNGEESITIEIPVSNIRQIVRDEIRNFFRSEN